MAWSWTRVVASLPIPFRSGPLVSTRDRRTVIPYGLCGLCPSGPEGGERRSRTVHPPLRPSPKERTAFVLPQTSQPGHNHAIQTNESHGKGHDDAVPKTRCLSVNFLQIAPKGASHWMKRGTLATRRYGSKSDARALVHGKSLFLVYASAGGLTSGRTGWMRCIVLLQPRPKDEECQWTWCGFQGACPDARPRGERRGGCESVSMDPPLFLGIVISSFHIHRFQPLHVPHHASIHP